MFWNLFKRPLNSEAQLRFMFRLGKEAAQQEQKQKQSYPEPIVLYQSCPEHGCLLKQAEYPDGNGNWSYCPQCRDEHEQLSCLKTLPLQPPTGQLLHVHNAWRHAFKHMEQKRIEQKRGFQLPPARPKVG